MTRRNEDIGVSTLDESLAFRERRDVPHEWLQLDNAAARRWCLRPWVELWEAVCLHSGLDPTTVPRGWVGAGTITREAIEWLVKGSLEPTPQRSVRHNLSHAIKALKSGDLVCCPWVVEMSHGMDTPVQIPVFGERAVKDRLVPAGPWSHRDAAGGRSVRYTMKFPTRPALALAAEKVLKRLWQDYADGRVIDEDVRAVLADLDDISTPEAYVIARFLDPRRDRRGRTKRG